MAEVSVQIFGSRVLAPLTAAGVWLLPLLLAFAFAWEVLQTLGASQGGAREPQQKRDARFMLLGATLGATAAYIPVATWLYVRFAMLVVLPTLGATVGLAVSGLLPAVGAHHVRVAELEQRATSSYVPRPVRRWLWTTPATVGVITAVRFILPEERPIPRDVMAQLGDPVLAPTRTLYLAAFAVSVALAVLAWAATAALVRRARTAPNPDELAHQEAIRRHGVARLMRWTTATMLLFSASLLTPLPAKMGGVVLSDVQLIQRITDLLTVLLLIAAAGVLFGSRRLRQLIGGAIS